MAKKIHFRSGGSLWLMCGRWAFNGKLSIVNVWKKATCKKCLRMKRINDALQKKI
jgi:hypothetical protein